MKFKLINECVLGPMSSKDGKGRKNSFFIVDKKEKKDDADVSGGEKKPVGERIADLMNGAKETVAGKVDGSQKGSGDEEEKSRDESRGVKDESKDESRNARDENRSVKDESRDVKDESRSVKDESRAGEVGSSQMDQEELEDKAFKGTGGAFFNNDMDSTVGEKEKSEEAVKEEKKEAHEGLGGAMFANDNPTEKEGEKDEELVEEKKKAAFSGTGGAMFANDTKDTREEGVDPEEAEERSKEAFNGAGGAFFNNDVANVAPKKEEGMSGENGSDEDRSEGGEDKHVKIDEDRSEGGEDKHVKIDEDKNESFNVSGSEANGAFVPAVLANPCDGSKIHDYRRDNLIEAEGFFYKKRIIFFCFWHRKYFVLLRDGTLVYHKCSGARFAKGNWSMQEATNFQKMDAPNSWHPYRFVFDVSGTELYFSYDTIEDRDYWYGKLEEASRRR